MFTSKTKMYILMDQDPDSGETYAIIGYTDDRKEVVRTLMKENLSSRSNYCHLVGVQVNRLGEDREQEERFNPYVRCDTGSSDEELVALAGDDKDLIKAVEGYFARREEERERVRQVERRNKTVDGITQQLLPHTGNSQNVHFIVGKLLDLGMLREP